MLRKFRRLDRELFPIYRETESENSEGNEEKIKKNDEILRESSNIKNTENYCTRFVCKVSVPNGSDDWLEVVNYTTKNKKNIAKKFNVLLKVQTFQSNIKVDNNNNNNNSDAVPFVISFVCLDKEEEIDFSLIVNLGHLTEYTGIVKRKRMKLDYSSKQIFKEFVELEFRNDYDCNVLDEYVKLCCRIKNLESEKLVQMFNYPERKGVGTNKAIQKTFKWKYQKFSSGKYQTSYSHWKKKQVMKWLKMTYFQPSNDTYETLVNGMKELKVLEPLVDVIEKNNHGLMLLKKELLNEDLSLIDILGIEDRKFTEEEKRMLGVLRDRLLGNIIILQLLELNPKHKFFSKPWMKTFHKVLVNANFNEKSAGKLEYLEHRLLLERRYVWDYVELRDWMMIIILFNRQFYYRRSERKLGVENVWCEYFKTFLKENYDENKTDDDEDFYFEGEIDPDIFEEYRLKFIDHIGFDLESISFIFQKMINRNNILKKKKNVLCEIKEKKEEQEKNLEEIKKLMENKLKVEEEKSEYENEMMDNLDYEDDVQRLSTKILNLLVETVPKIDETITNLEKANIDLDIEIEKLKEQTKLVEKEFGECLGGSNTFRLYRKYFYNKENLIKRRTEMKKMINERINFLIRKYGMVEIPVRLLVFKRIEEKGKIEEKGETAKENPFPLFHFTIKVNDCYVHWKTDSFIDVNDIPIPYENERDNYEEILCIDCHSAIFLNDQKTTFRILEFAMKIIEINSLQSYDSITPLAIVKSLLEKLKYPPFAPEIERCLREINDLKSVDKKNNEYVRSFNYDRSFSVKYERELIHVPYHRHESKQSKIIFNTHKDLDDFIGMSIFDSIESNYTGIFSLLKSFDTSYRNEFRKRKEDDDKDVEKYEKSKNGCPFVDERF